MFLLFYLIKLRAQYTLIYNFDASQNLISPGWYIQPGFTTSATVRIFGGYNELNETNTSLFYNQVKIIPHYSMKIEILVSRLGD